MTTPTFKIENGILAFTLVNAGDDASWQAPGGKKVDTVTVLDYETALGGDFSCPVNVGTLTPSSNTTQDTTDATFCSPAVVTTLVGVTSYALDATFIQDIAEDPAGSLSRYLFQYDTLEAYFLLGFAAAGPPKAIGRCKLVAGAIGGTARATLTATVSLPVSRKPDVMFGNATSSLVVEGATSGGGMASGALAGAPGSWTPVGAAPPATVAALQGAVPAITASPATAWTTGQYVQTGTAGAPGQAHWDGTGWVAGVVALADDEE